MYPYSSHHRNSLPANSPLIPMVVSPLRHKTPSLPTMRHSPSLQTLNFHPLGLQPLNSFRAKLRSRQAIEPVPEDVDLTPRPLKIKKLRKSPSMPFTAVREPRPLPSQPKRGPPPSRSFLGLSFPPQPKPRSSSAGVLQVNKGEKLGGAATGKETIRRASSQRTPERKEMPGAGMAWLQRTKSERPARARSPGSGDRGLDDIRSGVEYCPPERFVDLGESESQILPASRNSSGDATAGTSYRSCSYQSLDMDSTNVTAEEASVFDGAKTRSSDLRRHSSTGTVPSTKKHLFDFRNSNNPNKEQIAESGEKTPNKGWKEKMFGKDFFARGAGGISPKKDGKSKERERSSSASSTATVKTVHIPRASTAIDVSVIHQPSLPEVLMPSNHSWQGNSHRESPTRSDEWQLDGHISGPSLEGSGFRAMSNFNDSVLGIFEGNVGGMGRTKLRRAGQWKPPTLQLQLDVVAEREKVPISYQGGNRDDQMVWVSVEIDGKVDKGTEGFEGSQVGLDIGVLMDVSAYTSNASFLNMKLQAKRLVDAMETSRDRVAVMTFPAGLESVQTRLDHVHVLNSSGSIAKKQLMEDIEVLVQNKWDLDPAARDVRGAILASVKKLKGMPLDTARYGSHRHSHLFLLTAKLDVGELELLPEVFFGEIHIHIIGIGALFWPRNEMGASGWCIPTGTLGPRPNPVRPKLEKCEDNFVHLEDEGMEMKDIIRLLRKAVDLGVLHDLKIQLRAGEDCIIRAVMGDLNYPRIFPGEKRSLLVQVQVGDMPIPECEYDLDGIHEIMPRWVILERQLEATLGELRGRLLSVRATYRHSNFSGSTIFSTERNMEIARFAEDSLWRFSPTGNKLVTKEKSPSKVPVMAEDYVKKVLIQRVASMHSSPNRALGAIQEIAHNSTSTALKYDDISRELMYREKVEQKFRATRARHSNESSEELLIDLADRSNDRTPTPRNSWESPELTPHSRKPHTHPFTSAISPVTPPNRDCRYHGSRELHNEDRAPFIATVDSSPDTERPNVDPDDEAQRIWQEIKLRQRGFSSGSIKRRSVRVKKVAQGSNSKGVESEDFLSMVYSAVEMDSGDGAEIGGGRCGSRSGIETVHSMVTLRDVRETDFGPWAL